MKILKVKEIQLMSGMEYQIQSYPSQGAFFVNGRLLAVNANGNVFTLPVGPEFFDRVSESSGGVSESFILEFMDKTRDLVIMAPARAVRRSDLELPHDAST